MKKYQMTPAMANFKLVSINAEAESINSSDIYSWLDSSGLPPEISIRLKSLVELTKEVSGRIISIGRIILMKIIEFVKAHPKFFIGIAVGAAIGALANMIPLIGGLLSSITVPLGAFIGAYQGNRIDKNDQGNSNSAGSLFEIIPRDLINISLEFFQLLAEIFNVVFESKNSSTL